MAEQRERFRRGLRWLSSSQGYKVRLAARDRVEYLDAAGAYAISGEFLATKPLTFSVYPSAFADLDPMRRAVIEDNTGRLFRHFGWGLMPHVAGPVPFPTTRGAGPQDVLAVISWLLAELGSGSQVRYAAHRGVTSAEIVGPEVLARISWGIEQSCEFRPIEGVMRGSVAAKVAGAIASLPKPGSGSDEVWLTAIVGVLA